MLEIAPRVFQVEAREEADRAIAREIAELVREDPNLVLGLAAGTTPLGVYRELVRLVRERELDLAHVTTFNLDEYVGLPRGHAASFREQMRELLFDPGQIPIEHTHFPDDGEAGEMRYERSIEEAGGIDLQILGIGRNGHIGFNEPGSDRGTRTRAVELDPVTREDAAATFGGLHRVPLRAITIGVATILAARRIRVLAFGRHKAAIVRRTLLGPIGPEVPATYLREHGDVQFWIDRDAASELTPR